MGHIFGQFGVERQEAGMDESDQLSSAGPSSTLFPELVNEEANSYDLSPQDLAHAIASATVDVAEVL